MVATLVFSKSDSMAESFYKVNYGSSIIMLKILSENLSNQNKKSSFCHFNSHFVLKTTKTQVFALIIEIL